MSFRDMNTPETPLTDPFDVLRLLKEDHRCAASLFTPGGRRRLDLREGDLPRIEREFFGGHYDPLIGRHTYYVSRNAVMQLEDLGALQPTEHWGYTDYHERKISNRGGVVLWERVGQLNRLETVLRFFSGHPEEMKDWD